MDNETNEMNFSEKRKFKRLKSALPVDFAIVRLQGDLPGLDWEKGTTSNLSEGGICLETSAINESTINYLRKEDILLELKIGLPLGRPSIRVIGNVKWHQKIGVDQSRRYLIGLKYHSITKADLKTILQHAAWYNRFSKTAIGASLMLFLILVLFGMFNLLKFIFAT